MRKRAQRYLCSLKRHLCSLKPHLTAIRGLKGHGVTWCNRTRPLGRIANEEGGEDPTCPACIEARARDALARLSPAPSPDWHLAEHVTGATLESVMTVNEKREALGLLPLSPHPSDQDPPF